MPIKLISIVPSYSTKYKYIATLRHYDNEISIRFGAKGYGDYIQYYKEDPELAEKKKSAYIARHSVREDWEDPFKAGTLSRYILWNKPTLRESIADFRKRFEKK